MSDTPAHDSAAQPKATAGESSHNLSWIAMVVMAAMCLAALMFAASINLE